MYACMTPVGFDTSDKFENHCPRVFLVSISFKLVLPKKIRLTKNVEIMPPHPLLKFLATPLPALVVGEENLVIGFRPSTLEMLPPSLAVTLLDLNDAFVNFVFCT